MHVGIDEAGERGRLAEIDSFGARGGVGADFGVRADGEKAAVCDGDGLGLGIGRVHGVNHAVEQNEFGLGGSRREGGGSEKADEVATREVHDVPQDVLYASQDKITAWSFVAALAVSSASRTGLGTAVRRLVVFGPDQDPLDDAFSLCAWVFSRCWSRGFRSLGQRNDSWLTPSSWSCAICCSVGPMESQSRYYWVLVLAGHLGRHPLDVIGTIITSRHRIWRLSLVSGCIKPPDLYIED